MKHSTLFLCCLSFLVSITNCLATTPYIAFRSQSNNGMRSLCERRIPFGDYESPSSMLGITFMYQQSWKPDQIRNCLFGSPCHIPIQGSRFNNGTRAPEAWLADYFGLSTDFASVISYKPKVKNIITEFSGWWSCNRTEMFVDFQLPLIHTTTNLHLCEDIEHAGTLSYGNGYFTESLIANDDLLQTAQQFFEQQGTPNLGSETIFHPLTSSRFSFNQNCCSHDNKKTRLSDTIIRVGRDFVLCDNGCLSPYVRLSAPTGNKPNGIWLFEAIVGNGGHWGLGAGTQAQYCIWQHESCDYALYAYADTYAQHLFTTQQKRSFDLKNKSNSRYMLAQRLSTERQNPQLSGASDAGVEFANEYTSVSNLTYGCVNVSAAIEGEITARLTGHSNSWQVSLGYNFWARSHEKIAYKQLPCQLTCPWALKGDAQVIGFRITDSAPVHLAAVQNNATITNGTNNFPDGINGVASEQNPGIINPVPATTGAGVIVTALPFAVLGQTNTSNPVSTITLCDINMQGTRGISNSIFGYVAYAPSCYNNIAPRIELGGQAEFGSSSCHTKSASRAEPCSSSTKCALSTWAIWTTIALGF